jgi:hypothetical protein
MGQISLIRVVNGQKTWWRLRIGVAWLSANPNWGVWAVFLICLIFLNRLNNLGVFLGLDRRNNFLDITWQSFDLLVLVVAWRGLRKLGRGWVWFGLGWYLLGLIQTIYPFFIDQAYFSAYHDSELNGSNHLSWQQLINALVFHSVWVNFWWTTRFLAWLVVFRLISSRVRFGLVGLVFWYGLFDHLLLSSSAPLTILSLCLELGEQPGLLKLNLYSKSAELATVSSKFLYFLLTTWLGLNLATALWQVSFGQSLGLHWLGEPVLNLGLYNVAKQNFGGQLILRGYGLTQHPNILGFLGVVWLVVNLYLKKIQFDPISTIQPSKLVNWLGVVVGLGLIVVSLSRLAWIAGGVLFIWQSTSIYQKILTKFHLSSFYSKIWLGGLVGVLILVWLALMWSRTGADVYRLNDLRTWWKVYSEMSEIQRFFGLGLGQYPFYLFHHFGCWQTWRYEPTHNLGLGLLGELGILVWVGWLGLEFQLIVTKLRTRNAIK